MVETTKESYYLALRQTQGTLQNDKPNWHPWILFFLKALQQQKQRLEIKIEREKLLLGQLPELSLKILELTKSRGRMTISEIVTLTEANRNTIKKQLDNLVKNRHLIKHGLGKGVWYGLS